MPALLSALSHPVRCGEFSAFSLALVRARDAVSGLTIWEQGTATGIAPIPFTWQTVLAEIEALQGLAEWSIQLCGPLRLPLPPGHGHRGRGADKYAAPEDLLAAGGLDNLLARIRFQEPGPLTPLEAQPVTADLRWEDMRYNAERRIALGGVTGTVRWRARLEFAQARRLVLGQYFGAGKNARFGLGFWLIPELESVRSL